MGRLANFARNSPITATNMCSTDRVVSVVGGGLLTFLGGRKKSTGGKVLMIAGAELIRRGVTGHSYAYQALGVRSKSIEPWSSVSVPYELGVHVRTSITIAKPRDIVFAFWRDFENLPRIMSHLVSVTQKENNTSHWVARGPAGKQMEWDAEIINEAPNERIGWRSLPGSKVDNAGSVHFKDAPGGRGTEITVELQYNPPAGYAGAFVAKLFGADPETEIESDLFCLKQYLETGEVATTEGQSKGETFRSRLTAQEREQFGIESPEELFAGGGGIGK